MRGLVKRRWIAMFGGELKEIPQQKIIPKEKAVLVITSDREIETDGKAIWVDGKEVMCGEIWWFEGMSIGEVKAFLMKNRNYTYPFMYFCEKGEVEAEKIWDVERECGLGKWVDWF